MQTPYELLGVSLEATDAEIKQAYLQQVKDNPPDRDQRRFQAIHKAYDTIKDCKSRLEYDLFHVAEADFDALLDHALDTQPSLELTAEQVIELLIVSLDDKTAANCMSDTETP